MHFQAGLHLAKGQHLVVQVQIGWRLETQIQDGLHLLMCLLLEMQIQVGLHLVKGLHLEILIRVGCNQTQILGCGEVNKITMETETKERGVHKVDILVLVEGELGIDSHRSAMEAEEIRRGLPPEGRECVNSIRMDIAGKELTVTVCILKLWVFT